MKYYKKLYMMILRVGCARGKNDSETECMEFKIQLFKLNIRNQEVYSDYSNLKDFYCNFFDCLEAK